MTTVLTGFTPETLGIFESLTVNRRALELLVQTCSQAPDHPVLMSFPESEYLKCFVLQVV